jgi:hypothetical protein
MEPTVPISVRVLLFRKQQVLGSSPSVGSTPFLRAQEDLLTEAIGRSWIPAAGGEDLLTGLITRHPGPP